MDFGLEVEERGERVVVRVTGDLDILTAPELRSCLAEVIEGGHNQLVIDLCPTEFMDSSGLSALVMAVKRTRSTSGDVVLVCGPGNVRRVIQLVALDQVFRIYGSVAEAVAPDESEPREPTPG